MTTDSNRQPDLSKEEQAAIRALKRLAKKWPKSLWLFVTGTVHVMRCGEDGERVYIPIEDGYLRGPGESSQGGGVDPDYMVTTIKMPSDGGDW